jgi:hypothetical protein
MATAQAAPEPQLGFPTKGSLRRFPFPRLIREIARGNLTGSLYLLSGQTKKVVFFEAGQPIFVRSNVLSECLGQVLAQEGLITQEQCEQTLEAIRRTGKKQGELLVEMGILSAGNLRYGLQAQLRAKLFDIFGWEDGRYQFKPDTIEDSSGVRLDTSAEGVILAAIQDRYPEERARNALRDSGSLYPTLRGSPADFASDLGLELSLEEAFFVASLDGSRPLSAILQRTADPAITSPAALLYGLVQAGVIALVDEAQPPRAAIPRPAFTGGEGPDDPYAPGFEAQDVVTEYEDTPLPGELPKVRALLGDHEAEFAGVEDEDATGGATQHSVSVARPRPEVPEALVAAEPAGVEETFEEAIDLGEDESFDGVMPPEPSLEDVRSAPTVELPAMPERPELPPLVPERIPAAPASASAPAMAPAPSAERTGDAARSAARPSPVTPELVASTRADNGFDSSPRLRPDGEPDIDATRLDIGNEGLAPPISVDSIGHDLLAVDELDAIHIGQDDLAGLELEPGFDDAQPVSAELDLTADDDLVAVDDTGVGHEQAAAGGPPQGLVDDAADDLADDASDDDLAVGDFSGGLRVDAIDDDLALDASETTGGLPPLEGDGLVGFDDLDGIDLGGNLGGAPAAARPARHAGPEATFDHPADPEMLGAVRFNEAEAALAGGDFVGAVALLEEAYEAGFDVAELHAMLAFARFEAAGHDPETGDHALELLDYAQTMDPSLDMVHAYRGAIYRGLRQPQRAREALDRALELNPYCELAMQIMDTL